MVRIGSLELKETALSRDKGIALLNSSSPWASDRSDLQKLYESPHTSAVTTRTAVISPKDIERLQESKKSSSFQSTYYQDAKVHGHAFIKDHLKTVEGGRLTVARGSVNSYGYSPHPLSSYLEWIAEIFKGDESSHNKKPIILSITGPPDALQQALIFLRSWTKEQFKDFPVYTERHPFVGVEINLSCPNIKESEVPTGYDADAIKKYLSAVKFANEEDLGEGVSPLSTGLKLPPYIYPAHFTALVNELTFLTPSSVKHSHPIAFLTSTNTLGSSFWLNEGERSGELVKALPHGVFDGSTGEKSEYFDGTGGMAGESLHPLSLGNVLKLRSLLDNSENKVLASIDIIGVGGVMNSTSAKRMSSAGARAVALATALGREGLGCFERVSNESLLCL